jgi:DNA invertase Pin-like site-specific DNA recombinase
MAKYGYARVSSADQNAERQIIALRGAGVEDLDILVEKQSGKDFDRPVYQYLLRKLQAGDTLVIKSIDRFGRNYDEILDQWRLLSKRGIGIVVLDMPLLDTSKDRDLTGKLISGIVLQLLSYVAQTEREFINQRQAEGIAAAKARGVHFGRKPKVKPDDLCAWAKMWENGLVTSREAAQHFEISHTTFIRWAKEIGEHCGFKGNGCRMHTLHAQTSVAEVEG